MADTIISVIFRAGSRVYLFIYLFLVGCVGVGDGVEGRVGGGSFEGLYIINKWIDFVEIWTFMKYWFKLLFITCNIYSFTLKDKVVDLNFFMKDKVHMQASDPDCL